MSRAKQGITFFSSKPHHVHNAFIGSIGASPFLFKFDGKTKKPYMELVKAPVMRKPDSGVYICESPLYLFTVLPQKMMHPDIAVILLATSAFRMYYEKSGPAGKLLLREALKKADGIIAVSQYAGEFYKSLTSCPIKVAYPYADVQKYSGEYCDHSSRNICFLGKMMPYKGVDILLDSFRALRKSSPDSRLYLMGHFQGMHIPDMEGVEFAGKVDDPRDYFKKCSIYMHPAREEAFGISIIEACASGLMPIVSNRCGASEVIRDVWEGFVVDSLCPEDYASRALEVFDKGVEWQARMARALSKKAGEFSKERCISGFKEAYCSLMAEVGK